MSAGSAISMIETLVNLKVKDLTPFSATVDSLSGGKVGIRRLGSPTAEWQLYARLAGFGLSVGDEVICLNYLGAAFVLGRVQRTTAALVSIDGTLGLSSLNTAGTLQADGLIINGGVRAGAMSGTPTLTRQTGAGTTSTFTFTGGDYHGEIVFACSGTGQAAGTQVLIAFQNGLGNALYDVFFTFFGSAGADRNPYLSSRTTAGFGIAFKVAPAAGTTYTFSYWVVGR